MKRQLASTVAIVALASSSAFAQDEPDSDACAAQQAALDDLSAKYKSEQDRLVAEGQDIEDDAPSGPKISGAIVFEDSHMAFDVPQVTMNTKKIAFDVPQVTMKLKKISFDITETKMERRKTGQYPQVTCHGFGCTVTWKDIYTDVPVFTTTTKTISTDIPEVKMGRVESSFDLPQVKMNRVDMYFKLPHITVKDPIPDSGPTEQRSKALQADAEALSGKINADAAQATSELFACHTQQLISARAQMVRDFDDGASQLKSAIDTVKGFGADPANFTTDTGTMNLVQQLDDLLKARDAALAKIDQALQELQTGAEKDLKASAAIA